MTSAKNLLRRMGIRFAKETLCNASVLYSVANKVKGFFFRTGGKPFWGNQ